MENQTNTLIHSIWNNSLFKLIREVCNPQIVRTWIDKVYQLIFENPDKYLYLNRLYYILGLLMILNTSKNFVWKLKSFAWIPRYFYQKRYKFDVKQLKDKYGADCYVLITGFTDGIGFAYAKQFARLGFNLLLAGRNDLKINNAVKWLREINNTNHIKIVKVDFSDTLETLRNNIEESLSEDVDVGIIVNNVAAFSGQGRYYNHPFKATMSTLTVNIDTMIQINRIFIQRLRNRQKRSAIINLSSCMGVFPIPFTGVYSATKAYGNIYSRILAQENRDKIDILSVRPFGVCTAAMYYKKGPAMISPRQCVLGSLNALGKTDVTYGAFKHEIIGSIFHNMTIFQTQSSFEKSLQDLDRFRNL